LSPSSPDINGLGRGGKKKMEGRKTRSKFVTGAVKNKMPPRALNINVSRGWT